ncbi:hypothetical protein TeGR_g4937 [Tetraparma gracilis]|uniref:Heme-binding protein n=1 Tax=Tetraparma gracilis TaxID=2962635 RepID=A0ABQ6MIK2_9STRA|nr:hypothetical protein TeGR_g4937 [Tetraparma gracilis]
MSLTTSVTHLSLPGASLVLVACQAKASSMSLPVNISVCDAQGVELLFCRMQGAKVTSMDVARGKAYTSAGHRAPTRKFAEYAGVGGPAFGLHTTNGGRFSIVPGGLPVSEGGEVVGSVGVSGGTPDQDEEVARAGVEAWEKKGRARL